MRALDMSAVIKDTEEKNSKKNMAITEIEECIELLMWALGRGGVQVRLLPGCVLARTHSTSCR
jgi:hypothetical protein